MTRLLTVAQVAEVTGLTEYEVRAEVRRGVFPHREVGTRPLIRFTEADITEYLDRIVATQRRPEAASGLTARSARRRRTA